MDSLVYFHYNKCLFKCDTNMFNDNIKIALTSVFSCDTFDGSQLYMFDTHGIGRCIICAHVIFDCVNTPFGICGDCCNDCGYKYYRVEFYASMMIYINDTNQYVYRICTRAYYGFELIKFINNSHKLMHRFYHDTAITFLISTLDDKSYCYGIISDVAFHILKFIY